MRQSEALGQSEAFLEFQENLSRVAPVERPVLLLGERGTGKELAASRLHFLSKRWQGPFITLNCSTLTETLIESELFGYEKGAFTGAEKRRTGRFEAAHGGTLFLDEIGTLPMIVQEKLLRVVEYGSFERVGSSTSIEVDVRIVCATNANLVQMAEEEKFKRDLLDRLSFEVLFLPPLRHRTEDILLLAHHFGARMSFELQQDAPPTLSHAAEVALLNHPWRGNVRELKNVIERAVYKAENDVIDNIEFNPFNSPFPQEAKKEEPPHPPPEKKEKALEQIRPLEKALQDLEKSLLEASLKKSKYNQKKAAEILHLTYDQFRGKLKKHRSDLFSGD